MRISLILRSVAMFSLLTFPLGAIHAATISSSPFSLGYGLAANSATFDDSETADANTPVTGDFTLTPTINVALYFSANGPTFLNRVLGDGVDGSYSAESNGLVINVEGAYTGLIPDGATNVEIRINIDSISIWGARYNSSAGSTLAFMETTPGYPNNNVTSDPIALTNITGSSSERNAGLRTASNYTQLVWDPADFGTAGTTFTRTFELVNESTAPVDGFEIAGTIDIIYTPIPEPGSMMLLVLGTVGCVGVYRRRGLKAVVKS